MVIFKNWRRALRGFRHAPIEIFIWGRCPGCRRLFPLFCSGRLPWPVVIAGWVATYWPVCFSDECNEKCAQQYALIRHDIGSTLENPKLLPENFVHDVREVYRHQIS